MNNELLELLDIKCLHVHNIYKDELLPDIPLAIQGISTHYIMYGADIVYCGSVQGIRQFAINFITKEN